MTASKSMAVPRDTIIQTAESAASSPVVSQALTKATYWMSAAGVAGAVSNVDPIALVAVCVAVCTFVANLVWAWLRNRREAQAAEIQRQIDELTLAEMVDRMQRKQQPPDAPPPAPPAQQQA